MCRAVLIAFNHYKFRCCQRDAGRGGGIHKDRQAWAAGKSRESRQALKGSETHGIGKLNIGAIFEGEHPVIFQGLVPVVIIDDKKGVAWF